MLGASLPSLLAVAAVPAIGHRAGYERLGFLTIVWAAVGYLGFLDFGLRRVFSRPVAIADSAGDLAREMAFLHWMARRILFLTAGIAVLVAVVVPPSRLAGEHSTAQQLGEVRSAWMLLAASVLPLVLAINWRGAMEGKAAFGPVNVFRVAMGAWTFGAPLMLPFTSTLPALVGGIVVGRWVSLLLHQGWRACNMPPGGLGAGRRLGAAGDPA